MTTTIKRGDFALYGVCKCNYGNFKRQERLSDFQSYALRKIGECFMGKDAQFFWCDSAFCWFTDSSQQEEECVWVTENDILMYESNGELYRVHPSPC